MLTPRCFVRHAMQRDEGQRSVECDGVEMTYTNAVISGFVLRKIVHCCHGSPVKWKFPVGRLSRVVPGPPSIRELVTPPNNQVRAENTYRHEHLSTNGCSHSQLCTCCRFQLERRSRAGTPRERRLWGAGREPRLGRLRNISVCHTIHNTSRKYIPSAAEPEWKQDERTLKYAPRMTEDIPPGSSMTVSVPMFRM